MPIDWMTAGLAVSGLAWFYLGFFHHGFWRSDQVLPKTAGKPSKWPAVTAIIPARNEEKVLSRTLPTVAGQKYKGKFRVILVNDSSTDRTAEVAAAVRGVKVLNARALEPGWAGKMWAMKQGVEKAIKDFPETQFFWFTDADIAHSEEVLESLVRAAVLDNRAMVSQMVFLHCKSFWERAFVPAFIFFFQMLYPFRAANSDTSPLYGAAGGCILLDRDWLLKIGGLERIKTALIDDCEMARGVKREGGRIWLGFGLKSHSLRPYGFFGFWTTVARTAFTQLKNSGALLLGTVIAMSVVFILPPLAAVWGLLAGENGIAGTGIVLWGAMILFYTPTLTLYRLHPFRGYGLPVIAILYMAMTIHSALRHWLGRGGQWKDRSYDFE